MPYLLPRSFIVVHIGTNMHLFEYKLQRCPYKGTVVYIFHIVFCVCCMYSTWHTVKVLAHSHTNLFCSIIQLLLKQLLQLFLII